jgi:hypothetical protein
MRPSPTQGESTLVELQTKLDDLDQKIHSTKALEDAVSLTWGQIRQSKGENGVRAAQEAAIQIKTDLDSIECDTSCLVEIKISKEKKIARASQEK